MNSSATTQLLVILIGGLTGAALFLAVLALYGLPARRPGSGPSRLARLRRDVLSPRGAVAVVIGILVLAATRWVVAGVGVGLLAYSWRSISGARSERQAIARLEGLATWTESLRDTIAGAVGLEQAIPSSTQDRGAGDQGAAAQAGRPAAHPGADAGRAAPVRQRPGRLERRPDHRGADHQLAAARPWPARPARRAVPVGPRGARHAPQGQRGAAVNQAQRADRRPGLGRHGARARVHRPCVPRPVQLTVRPGRARPHRRTLRAGDLVAAQARQVRVAAAAARRRWWWRGPDAVATATAGSMAGGRA